MEARETTFSTLFNGRVQYRIPLFQRQYAWRPKDREQLWSDIVELRLDRESSDDSSEALHFLGSVVTASDAAGPNRPAFYTLIDGQQRITTLSILLAALRDHLRPIDEFAADRIDGLYLINQFPQDPNDRFKVLPTQRDRDEFAAVILGHEDTGTSKSIREAYDFFRRQLVKLDSDTDVRTMEAAVLQGLAVVAITLDQNDNAYRVFESLNAKGLPLAQVDLVRNLFMMKLGPEQAEAAYTKFWLPMQERLGSSFDDYIHDYYLQSGDFLRADATYEYAKRKLNSLSAPQVQEALSDMAWSASRWEKLKWPEQESDPQLRSALTDLQRFGAETPYPFLLNVYQARDRDNALETKDFVQIVRFIESFLVRRMFANIPTNTLNRLFIRLWHQLDTEKYGLVDAVQAALSIESRRWPTDSQFRSAFTNYPLYTDSRTAQCRLVLDKLERSFGHHEAVNPSNLQIEHIIPQTITEDWIDTLGGGATEVADSWLHTVANLTLTGYNPELSNSSWADKKSIYAASNVSMTRELADIGKFDESALRERAAQLADRAIRIWPSPIEQRRAL